MQNLSVTDHRIRIACHINKKILLPFVIFLSQQKTIAVSDFQPGTVHFQNQFLDLLVRFFTAQGSLVWYKPAVPLRKPVLFGALIPIASLRTRNFSLHRLQPCQTLLHDSDFIF